MMFKLFLFVFCVLIAKCISQTNDTTTPAGLDVTTSTTAAITSTTASSVNETTTNRTLVEEVIEYIYEDEDDYVVYIDEYDDYEDYDYRKARHLQNNSDKVRSQRDPSKQQKRRQGGHASHKRVKPIGRCASGKEGKCVAINGTSEVINCDAKYNYCKDDCDCPGYQKCCTNSCGKLECLPSISEIDATSDNQVNSKTIDPIDRN